MVSYKRKEKVASLFVAMMLTMLEIMECVGQLLDICLG